MSTATTGFRTLVCAVAVVLVLGGCGEQQQEQSTRTPDGDQVSPPVKGEPWSVPGLGMEMVYVQAGTVRMEVGGGEENGDATSAQQVKISTGFWVGKYEVTQQQYQSVMATNPSHFPDGDKPVELVSWYQAKGFCRRLTRREQHAGRLMDGYRYRLPTEAQWKYAAAGASQLSEFKFSGSNEIGEVAWYLDNSAARTHAVGQKKPNSLGMYDVSGNVWEWCRQERVYRGGSWIYPADTCRLTSRVEAPSKFACNSVGFRVVLVAGNDE